MKSLLFFAFCTLLKNTGAVCYSGSSPVLCSDDSCNGSCTIDNGCICNDGITNCIPTGTLCPMDDNTCCASLNDLFWNNDLKCCTDKPICNPGCFIDETCVIENNVASCICNKTIYSGLTISGLKPSVNCDGGTMIASVSQCKLKQLGYNYSSFHLINDSINCTYIYPENIHNVRVESIQVKAVIGWCGNIAKMQDNSSKILFTNTLHIDPFRGPLITRNPIVFNFSCEYNLTMKTSLNFALNPVVSSVVIPPSGPGIGSFTVTLAAYSDAEYSVPIQLDEEILVGSNIYLGLFSPDLDGNVFALRAEKCFATPSSNPDDPNNVLFVSGGCAVSDNIESTVLENGISTEARIQISAFLFQGFSQVYIFCDVKICNKTNGCKGCNVDRSLKADLQQLGIQLNLQANDDFGSSGHHTAVSWPMLLVSLLGLLSLKLF